MDTQKHPGKPWKCSLNSALPTARGHVTVYRYVLLKNMLVGAHSLSKRSALVTQPMLQPTPNQTKLRLMVSKSIFNEGGTFPLHFWNLH